MSKFIAVLLGLFFYIPASATLPTYGYVPFNENLLNASSKAMNVNGSSVNQTFSYTATTRDVVITGITVVLQDEGNTNLNRFGAITALTNGIVIGATISSVGSSIATIRDNAEMFKRFSINSTGSSAVLSLLGITTPLGFGDTVDMFQGTMQFAEPLRLNSSTSDGIGVVIRDNLTAIDLLEMSIKGYGI